MSGHPPTQVEEAGAEREGHVWMGCGKPSTNLDSACPPHNLVQWMGWPVRGAGNRLKGGGGGGEREEDVLG